MKPIRMLSLAAVSSCLVAPPLSAQESPRKPEGKPGPFVENFDALPEGDLPDSILVIDGAFRVVKGEDAARGNVVELPGSPIQESGFVFGNSSRGEAVVQADFLAKKKRRAFPRFGVALHGLPGYRFRVVPARGRVELLRNETELVGEAAFDWDAGRWLSLRLEVRKAGAGWEVRAWAWDPREDLPEEPLLRHQTEDAPGQGKPTVWGTPYASLPIRFDNLRSEP